MTDVGADGASLTTSAADESDRALARLQFGSEASTPAHLNNAGAAPMAAAAEEAGIACLRNMRQGTLGFSANFEAYERARRTFGTLVGCDGARISFFQTCAAAISQVAMGFLLHAGEEIVRLDQEYPSNAYPWHRAAERVGARVIVVPSDGHDVDTARVIDAITLRTRVVAISWVQFQTGAMCDLRAIADAAHAVGAWVVVDAIQGLGVIPFDMDALGVDAVCGGTHKWLLGPVGHGFLALSKGRETALTPLFHGAFTYGTSEDPVDPTRPARADARRFEPGTPLLLGALTSAAAIRELLTVGIERVHGEALALADLTVRRAQERGFAVLSATTGSASSAGLRSPIVTFVPRGDPDVLTTALRRRAITVAARAGGLRVSPHVHNQPAHIEALFAALDELA